MAQTERLCEINLTRDQMYFYEKNIIHDIIHDYGFYSAVTRWVKNINNLRSFANEGFTIFVDNGTVDDGDDDDDGDDTEGGGVGIWKGGANPGEKTPEKTDENAAVIETQQMLSQDPDVSFIGRLEEASPSDSPLHPTTILLDSPVQEGNVPQGPDPGQQQQLEQQQQLQQQQQQQLQEIKHEVIMPLLLPQEPPSEQEVDLLAQQLIEVKSQLITNNQIPPTRLQLLKGVLVKQKEENADTSLVKRIIKVLRNQIKLTRSINTDFVNALKNFFVFNLFESLIKIIKSDGVTIPDSSYNNIISEIYHDIFFSNLDFFYYYDDDGEININVTNRITLLDDMIAIFGSNTSDNTKSFDFIGFLNNIYTCFLEKCNNDIDIDDVDVDDGQESPRKKPRAETYSITNLFDIFDSLTSFLDTTKNKDGTQLDVINYYIYETITTGSDNAMDETGGGKSSIYTMKGGENQNRERLQTILNQLNEERRQFLISIKQRLSEKIQQICQQNPDRNAIVSDDVKKNFIKDTLDILNRDIGVRIFADAVEFMQANNENLYIKLDTNLRKLSKKNIANILPETRNRIFYVNTREIDNYTNFGSFCSKNNQEYVILEKIMETYERELNGLLYPCLKIIEDQKKKYELEDEKENLEKIRRERSDQASGLGDKKIVQENFLTAVAKLGLFLNEENFIQDYRPDNYAVGVNNDIIESLCNLEFNILKYYANGCLPIRPSYRDLDTILYSEFKNFNGRFPDNQFNSEDYMCNKKKFYMIDNAAALNSKRRKNCVFCPLTSVCDGMGQCTLGSTGEYGAEIGTNIEQGNMNFSVQFAENDTAVAYYKGKLELTPNPTGNLLPTSAKYTINYKGFRNTFPRGPNIDIETTLDINIGSSKIKNLEAHNVLKNTLVAILKFIVAQYNGNVPNIIAEYLTSGDDVFSNIVNIITEDEIRFNNTLDENGEKTINSNLNNNYNNPENTPDTTNTKTLNDYLLNTFFKILGKGAGDIFQEINAICKHGGYTGGNYYKAPDIIKWDWDNDGDAIRFFAAKDRPSACRFMFLTWFADNVSEINQRSLGGFIAEKTELIVQKISTNPNYDLCGAVATATATAAAGGGKANTKKRKQSHKHSRKPHKKTKKHKKVKHLKRTKKYSQSKKHKKTKKRKQG